MWWKTYKFITSYHKIKFWIRPQWIDDVSSICIENVFNSDGSTCYIINFMCVTICYHLFLRFL